MCPREENRVATAHNEWELGRLYKKMKRLNTTKKHRMNWGPGNNTKWEMMAKMLLYMRNMDCRACFEPIVNCTSCVVRDIYCIQGDLSMFWPSQASPAAPAHVLKRAPPPRRLATSRSRSVLNVLQQSALKMAHMVSTPSPFLQFKLVLELLQPSPSQTSQFDNFPIFSRNQQLCSRPYSTYHNFIYILYSELLIYAGLNCWWPMYTPMYTHTYTPQKRHTCTISNWVSRHVAQRL